MNSGIERQQTTHRDSCSLVRVQEAHVHEFHQTLEFEKEAPSTLIPIRLRLCAIWVVNDYEITKWVTIGQGVVWTATVSNTGPPTITILVR